MTKTAARLFGISTNQRYRYRCASMYEEYVREFATMNPPNAPSPANPYAYSPSAGNDPLADPNTQPWERNYSMAMHLTTLAWHFVMPLIPAVIMYLIKKDESPFVADHGREAINFQLSLLVYGVLGGLAVAACGIGVLVLGASFILMWMGTIMAAVAASKGRYYRYPACIRFLKA